MRRILSTTLIRTDVKCVAFGAVLAISLVLFLAVGCTSTAFAADKPANKSSDKSSSKAAAPAATASNAGVQGYTADTPIGIGTIVRLADSAAHKVAVSDKADLSRMYGVAVDRQRLQVSISDPSAKNQVFVATSGTYPTLVSSQGGSIKAGDYVTLSSVNGVAMKAGDDDVNVFGRAGANFDGKHDGTGKVTLKDTTGKQTGTAILGTIPVAIDVRTNPEKKSTKTKLPPFLQRLGEAIAEKPVGPLRIYLSIGITAICIISAIVILYSGIRSSLISIGRNPLSKKSIFRGLLEIILTSLLILIIGMFAVYLLLKL